MRALQLVSVPAKETLLKPVDITANAAHAGSSGSLPCVVRTQGSMRLVRLCLLGLGWLMGGCEGPGWWEEPKCEEGLCPAGMRCAPDTGRCVASAALGPAGPALHGRFQVVRKAGEGEGSRWWLGYEPARQSLALWDGSNVRYLDGPAAGQGAVPAGQASALIKDPKGGLIAAWLRASDGSVWCAWSRMDWAPVQVHKGGAEGSLALAADNTTVWLASRDALARTVAVASLPHPTDRRSADAWSRSLVTAPTGMGDPAATPLDLGRWLAMTVTAGGPVLAAYEAIGGDLVLATRSDTGWQASRVAGRDRTTGANTTDAGQAVAMTVALGGALLVAYRDRTLDEVVLLRDVSGVVTTNVVGNGTRLDSTTGTQRSALYGSQIALAARPDGRAVVAIADGVRWAVDVAAERPDGSFAHAAMTPAETGGPLSFPALEVTSPSSVRVYALRARPEAGPAGNQIEAKTLDLSGALP